MVKPINKSTVIRTLFLFLALVNQILVSFGVSPLPIDEPNTELVISTTWTGIAALMTWWKNNDITKKARTENK